MGIIALHSSNAYQEVYPWEVIDGQQAIALLRNLDRSTRLVPASIYQTLQTAFAAVRLVMTFQIVRCVRAESIEHYSEKTAENMHTDPIFKGLQFQIETSITLCGGCR